MAILIKGMEMPETCTDCLFYREPDIDYGWDDYCEICKDYPDTGCNPTTHRAPWCPLVEVPEQEVGTDDN